MNMKIIGSVVVIVALIAAIFLHGIFNLQTAPASTSSSADSGITLGR